MKLLRIVLFSLFWFLFIPNQSHAQIIDYHPKADTLYIVTTSTPGYSWSLGQENSTDSLSLNIQAPDNESLFYDSPDMSEFYENLYILVDNSSENFTYRLEYALGSPEDNINTVNFDENFVIDFDFGHVIFTILDDSGVVDSLTFTFIQQFGLSTENTEQPKNVELFQNYPNPFNPVTNISFELTFPQRISLSLYSVTGRLLYILKDNTFFGAGTHTVQIHNDLTANLASGVYLYVLKTEHQRLVKSMTLIK